MAQSKTALITGGAKGIGRAIGQRLAERGWSIAVCYRTSEREAATLVEEARAGGVRALARRCDVSDPTATAALVGEVLAEWGELGALIHCAGPFRRRPLLEESVEGWNEMFDANLHSLFYLARLVAPPMIERGWGRIPSFAVANADRLAAQPNVTAYTIAKMGTLALTRTLAKVLGPHGITANSISPGFIDAGGPPIEELGGDLGSIPAGHVGEPRDVVSAAEFLLSVEARYVNGTNLHVSGGWGV